MRRVIFVGSENGHFNRGKKGHLKRLYAFIATGRVYEELRKEVKEALK